MVTIISEDKFDEYRSALIDRENKIAARVNALFCLRTLATLEAVQTLIDCFNEEQTSQLLRHEICYCLGQMDKSPEHVKKMTPFLETILLRGLEGKEDNIVVHEAAEALGHLGSEETRELLSKFDNYKESIVYETCKLSDDLLQWNTATNHGETEKLPKSKFTTNDPAPFFNYVDNKEYADLAHLRKIYLDKEWSLFDRYRAMFTLRELNTIDSVLLICECFWKENSPNCSELLKHEAAFVIA